MEGRHSPSPSGYGGGSVPEISAFAVWPSGLVTVGTSGSPVRLACHPAGSVLPGTTTPGRTEVQAVSEGHADRESSTRSVRPISTQVEWAEEALAGGRRLADPFVASNTACL